MFIITRFGSGIVYETLGFPAITVNTFHEKYP